VHGIRILDRTLEVGLSKALDVALDEGSWKPVELSVHLAGKKPHDLLVSYVVEMPTWKPAYRIVLDKEGKALLQGWAVVDNVSGEDWNGVQMSLTAGTPLTFTYDLYTPRFVGRQDLSPRGDEVALAPPPPPPPVAAPSPEPMDKTAEESASASEEMNAQATQMKDVAAELMAIVGGDLETRASASVSGTPQKAVLKKVLSFKGFGKKADAGAKDVRPEAVIPLDDKDFKNF
jgi:hypothetical protein